MGQTERSSPRLNSRAFPNFESKKRKVKKKYTTTWKKSDSVSIVPRDSVFESVSDCFSVFESTSDYLFGSFAAAEVFKHEESHHLRSSAPRCPRQRQRRHSGGHEEKQ